MRRLALATIFVASSAFAQTAPVGPDNGFFRPTPGNDPSLTNYLVPLQQSAPQQQPPQQQPPQQVVAQPVVIPMPAPIANAAAPVQVVEEQVDKAIREADEARARAAATVTAPIVGAFTGSTSERDR